MRSILQTTTLLATLLTLTLAKPIPMSDEDIQRRWSLGDSEVCCSPNAPGCYVLAWVRSLAAPKKQGLRDGATIHAASTYRDATPAWPVLGRGGDDIAFTYATDERTMALHKRESPMTASLLAQMKTFVRKWYKSRGKVVNVGKMEKEHSGKMREAGMMVEREVEEAPVLKPKRGMVYRFNA